MHVAEFAQAPPEKAEMYAQILYIKTSVLLIHCFIGVSSASPATTGRDEWPSSTLNEFAMCMSWDLCIKREEMSMPWDLDIKGACYMHAVGSSH